MTVVEPGRMPTDWAGSSMITPPLSEPYQATVGKSARPTTGPNPVARGDPKKVAQLVLTVAEFGEPPLPILAGNDAYEYGPKAWRHRIATDAKWESLSRSTDHDAASDSLEQHRVTSLPRAPA